MRMEPTKKYLSRRKFLSYLFTFPLAVGVVTPLALSAGVLSPPLSLKPLPPVWEWPMLRIFKKNP